MITSIGVTLTDVLKAGLRASDYSAWHDPRETPDGKWYWHASSLGYCPRQLILKRADLAPDGKPFEGQMTLRQGTVAHMEIERCIQAWQAEEPVTRQIVVQEVGYYHKDIPLAAKPDAVISNNGRVVLVDFKTEHEYANKHRKEEARQAGRNTAAKFEHQLQLTATAMVLESNGIHVDEGRVWYLTKSAWWPDEQPVDVNDTMLRAEVDRIVRNLETSWIAWGREQALPKRIPLKSDGIWQCKPRSETDTKGRYCEARSICYKPTMPE